MITITRPAPQVSITREGAQVNIEGPKTTVVVSHAGVPGPAGTGGFNYVQESANTVWTINHNLGYKPSVTLFTVGNVEFEGNVVHTTVNQCVVYLLSAMAGSARLV